MRMRLTGLWCMVLAGCGGTATTTATPTDANTSGDVTVNVDAATTDTGPADTGATTPDTSSTDTGASTGDKTCNSALDCLAGCSGATCDACSKGLSATAQGQFSALATCAIDLCSDATTATARTSCIVGKCGDKLGACANSGFGLTNCAGTASCVGRCANGALGCQAACLFDASTDAMTTWSPLASCVAKQCNGVVATERAACIASQCRDAAQACRGAGFDCTGITSCYARCPAALPGKPNDCAGYCDVLADSVGLALEATYTACKESNCSGVLNKFTCWHDKCAGEQAACFGAGGTASCMDMFKCVASKCQGLGGDPACVAGCLADADAQAKDAWVHYEGCFLSHLDSQQAINAKCAFPYDQATCVDTVAGTFCPNESSACFKP